MATETTTIHRSSLLQSEDWWAVWLGLFIFALGAGKIWNLGNGFWRLDRPGKIHCRQFQKFCLARRRRFCYCNVSFHTHRYLDWRAFYGK